MATDDPRLEDVASAILDGTAVDWSTVESGTGAASPSLLQHLKIVAAVADVHRTANATEPSRSWGPLRILERIGVGSFGEVFRAWDSRLDREVALKLLPADTTPGHAATSVIHEGRLLARIHHPNVVTIYGAERLDGMIGLWMEFVHGKTLAQLMEDGRVFTPREVAAMGAELCDALTAVHEAGLLHRDVKAANVMIADDGRVVLMDFGTGTDVSRGASEELAGTPLYLAPELLAGSAASNRSDLYSVGVLLYHLLTRSYPVTANSLGELRSAHAQRQPARINAPGVPPKLARILDRVLDPRPERRHQSAAVLRAELLSLDTGTRKGMWAVAAAALMFAAVPAWMFFGDAKSTTSEVVNAPRITRTELLTQTGDAVSAALSPDGRFVVMDTEQGGRSSLWLKHLTTGATEALAGPAPVRYSNMIISRDGRFLFYFRSNRDESGRTLYRQPLVADGEPQLVYRASGLQGGTALSPDGRRVAVIRTSRPLDESRLVIVNVDDGSTNTIGRRSFASAYWQLAWSPDGRTLAAVTGSADAGARDMHVVTVNVEDGSEQALTREPWTFLGRLEWLPDGTGLLMVGTLKQPRTDQIWLLSYPAGTARRITDDVNRYRGVSLNAGATAFVTGQVRTRRTIWVAPVGPAGRGPNMPARVETGAAREIAGGWGRLAWTREGDIVFSSSASGTPNIWRAARDGTRPRQLTRLGINTDPALSACGMIVFEGHRGDGYHLWRMEADGSNPVQITNGAGDGNASITPDCRWVIFNTMVDRTLWKVPLEGGVPTRLTNTVAREPAVSPDGRWIAYNASAPQPPGPWRITIVPLDGGPPWKVFTRPPTELRTFELQWTPDGTAITYEAIEQGVSNIWSQPLAGGPPRRVTNFTSDYIFSFAWSADGTQLAALRGAFETNIVLYSLGR